MVGLEGMGEFVDVVGVAVVEEEAAEGGRGGGGGEGGTGRKRRERGEVTTEEESVSDATGERRMRRLHVEIDEDHENACCE